MEKTLTFDFCEMTIYDKYVVVVMKEGVNITPGHNNVLIDVTKIYFSKKSFVYITHRINSYSVDPQIYLETAKIENLKGFAVVSKNYKAKVNAQIEKMFFNKPFEIFTNLENAFSWADGLLK
jgi:hypothetical protein